jgi:hypothetical protein
LPVREVEGKTAEGTHRPSSRPPPEPACPLPRWGGKTRFPRGRVTLEWADGGGLGHGSRRPDSVFKEPRGPTSLSSDLLRGSSNLSRPSSNLLSLSSASSRGSSDPSRGSSDLSSPSSDLLSLSSNLSRGSSDLFSLSSDPSSDALILPSLSSDLQRGSLNRSSPSSDLPSPSSSSTRGSSNLTSLSSQSKKARMSPHSTGEAGTLDQSEAGVKLQYAGEQTRRSPMTCVPGFNMR